MSTTEQPDSALVAHNELDIPGRTGPVSDGPPPVWGINRAAAQDNFPQQGLLCRAGPWGQMNAGDKVNIYWGDGQLVLPKTVQEHEVNTELQMFIASKHFEPGTYAVYYNITRLNQAPEPSEVMQVQVKLTRPGGHDDTEEPGHPHLLMSIPKEILEGGVHSENVEKGVEITIGEGNGAPPYPDAAPGDRMRITWGGVFVNSDALSQEQAEGKAPIVVTIAAKTITDAGDSDAAGLAVAFEVYDVVQNRSEDWSVEQRVVVAVSTTLLGAPLLKEAQNNVLDIDLLGDADGTAQVIAMNAPGKKDFEVGDTVYVRIKGTPKEGAPIDVEIHGEPLVSVPSILEIKIRNAILRPLAKTQIALSYRLQKADGSPDKPAKTQFISAIGEIERLAAPVALDAVQGALDPQLDQVRVLIPWHASFKAGDAIKTFYLGTPPSTIPYLPDLPLRSITQGDIDQAEDLLIIIDKAHLAPINGGTLVLYYQLLIEDAVLAQMDELGRINAVRESIRSETLQVGEPRQELPAPEVAGVVDGVLPPDTNGTTLTVTYLDTVAGDEVTYQWIGSKTGETTDSVVLTSFTAGRPVQFTIRAEFIKGNEGGTVSAKYEIKRVSGKTSYSNALDFSVGVALDLKEPEIKQANGTSLDPLDAQNELTAVIDYVGMLVDDKITVTWAATAGTPADGSHTTAPWPVATVEPQEIPLLQSVVAFNLGKPVTVSYTVSRGSGEPVPSLQLTLTVQALQQKDLPRPEIDGMPGEALDVHALVDTASTRIAKWPFIAVGQILWMRYFGTKADNSPYSSQTYNATPVPSAGLPNGMYPYAPVADLRGLKDGSELKIEFKVTFDRDTNEATAQTFPVRTYSIKAVEDVVPTITSISGSPSGDDIPEGAIIVETAVTLTGIAAKGQKVRVLDGTTSKGEPTADPVTGIWKLTVTGLTVAPHSFTAKALYGSEGSSTARTLIVTAIVVPTLSNVWDANNVEVPQGTMTVSTELKLRGTASLGQQVEIFDGTGSGAATKGTATADRTTGIWELPITVPLGARRLYAEACYPSNPLYSNVRNLTVTEDVAPTLTSVRGSPSGVEIPQNGTTVETAVTLSGVAAKGQQVEVFDGTVSKGPATAHATTGVWTLLVSRLTVAAHSFTAKALYGSVAVSAARTLTVTAATAPTLTSAKGSPSGVEIPQNGTTVETAVTLSGVAAKGQQIEVFDGVASKGKATADPATGKWEWLVTGLSAGAHSFEAKALYAPGAVSNARTLVVAHFHNWTGVPEGNLPTQIPQNYPSRLILTMLRNDAYRGYKTSVHTFPSRPRALFIVTTSIASFTFGGNIRSFVFNIADLASPDTTFRLLRSNGTVMHSGKIPISNKFTYTSSGEPFSSVEITGGAEPAQGDLGFIIIDMLWFKAI